MFGANVARRVRLLSKVPKEGYLERLHTADRETVLVKACDKLDNFRSLSQTSPEFKMKQINETVSKYYDLFDEKLENNHPVVVEIKQIIDLSDLEVGF